MVTKEDIEGWLNRIAAEGATQSEVEPGLWIVRPSGELDFSVVVHFEPPVVLLRVKVMAIPREANAVATLSPGCWSSTRPSSFMARTASSRIPS